IFSDDPPQPPVVRFGSKIRRSGHIVAGSFLHSPLVKKRKLAVASHRLTVANVPPFVPDGVLLEELVKHGKVVSPLKKLSSGCKSPLMRHVVSHRRQLHMVLTKPQALHLVIKVKIEGFDYAMFATSDDGRCFRCGGEGHLARGCPERNPSSAPLDVGASVRGGEAEPVGQVDEGVTVGTGEGGGRRGKVGGVESGSS
uniref:CCHC-type domain-containing protein n=1 Tax=Gasterosteus aculeatus TaxID=69293 RepID=G3PJQ9_GASAC